MKPCAEEVKQFAGPPERVRAAPPLPPLLIYVFSWGTIRQTPSRVLVLRVVLCNVFLDICGSAGSILSVLPGDRAVFLLCCGDRLYITAFP